MGSKNKLRGTVLEREIANSFREKGFLAERAYASNGKALGQAETVDVLVGGKVRIQAKRRKKLADYLQIPAGCDAVVFRQDRKKPLVLIDLDYFQNLLKKIT
jgi:Holliday junction resolvase